MGVDRKTEATSYAQGRSSDRTKEALIALFVATIICVAFVTKEDPIYIWDWRVYSDIFHEYGANLYQGHNQWLRWLWASIKTEDYNGSSVVPLLGSYFIFDDARIGFILSIAIIYVVPVVLILSSLTRYVLQSDTQPNRRLEHVVIFGLALLFWPLWAPSLRGQPDAVGLIPLGLATIILVKSDYLSRRAVLNGAVLGLLVWSAFLLRRWYAYSAVAFIALGCLASVILVFGDAPDKRMRRIKSAATGYACLGVVLVACLLLFQRPLVLRILGTSYSSIYAGYQAPFAVQLWSMYGMLGLPVSVSFLCGLIFAALERKTSVLICAAMGILTFLLLSTTQAPSVQHWLPIFFWMFPAMVYGVLWPMRRLTRLSPVVVGVAILMAGLSFLSVFSPAARARLSPVERLLPGQTFFPLRLENIDQYRKLIQSLKDVMAPEQKVAVFASHPVLADVLLDAIDPKMHPHIAFASQVDSRDGLKLGALRADYAVVTNTAVVHLGERSQQVIVVPNREILAGTGVGEGYQRIAGPFALADGIQGFIYRRNRPLSDADISTLLRELQQSYPTWHQVSPDLIGTPETGL